MAIAARTDHFAEKLALALERAQMSRAAVAREVGIDKSVVARWVAGHVHPTEHSLIALTEVLSRRLPGFALAHWRLPEAAFVASIGEAPPPPPQGLLANATAWAAPGLERAFASYGGLWLFLYDSVRVHRLFGMICEIRAGEGVLEAEVRDDENWHGRGPAFALHGKLWMTLEEIQHRDSFGFGCFWGTTRGKAEILDGLAMVREFAPSAAPGATHVAAFRLADPLVDPEASAARYQAAVARVARLNQGVWEEVLPAGFAEGLRKSVSSLGATLRLGVETSLAVNEFDLKAAEASEGPRRGALALLRGLFRDVIA